MRGKSQNNSVILSLASSGFLLCSLRGDIIIDDTLFDIGFIFPLIHIKQISAFDFCVVSHNKNGFQFLGLVFTV